MSGNPKGYSVAFLIALVANAFFFLGFQAGFPVLPRFIADVVVNRPPEEVGGYVGLATTVTALISVLTRIPTGRLTDRFGRRRFMILGAICFTFAPLIFVLSRGMPTLLLGRGVQGLGLAMFTTAFQALVTDLAPEGRRGEALGLAGASVSIAFIAGPLAGDWLYVTLGYAPFFRLSAVTGALSALLAALITAPASQTSDLPPPRIVDDGQPKMIASPGVQLALAQKGVRASVLTMAALGIPFGAFVTFLPLFAEEQRVSGAGAVFSIYAGTALLAQPVAGWLSDRLGRRGVILSGLVTTSLATWALAMGGSLSTFALAGIIFGLGGGLVRGGVDALVQDSVPPALRGTAAAVQYTSFDLLIGLGSYPLGVLADALGYALTFVCTGITCLLGGGGLAVMLRDTSGEGRKSRSWLSSSGD